MNMQIVNRWTRAATRAGMVALIMGIGSNVALAEIPEPLEGIVFGDEKRTVQQTEIDGVAFEFLTTSSDVPFLMWPAEGRRVPAVVRDRDTVARWLNRAADELGFTGFEAQYADEFRWRENNVWSYELMRNGLPLQDAQLMVHWKGDTFLGVVNKIPTKIVSIQDPKMDMGANEIVYFASRAKPGEYNVIPAEVIRERKRDRLIVTTTAVDGTNEIVEFPDPPLLYTANVYGEFTEWDLPIGGFPDQISVDDNGTVWLSQPNDNRFTEFDPVTEQFTQHLVTGGGNGPDGLIVGTQGRVWSGMYYSRSLGMWDSNTDIYYDFPVEYGAANPAVPVETSDGNIWVTDHIYNRVSAFDPSNQVWVQSLVMPTPACWVVQGYEDFERGDVYFTEFNVDQLARLSLANNTITDIVVPGGGPAFCVYSDGLVYYSRWNESGMGVLDVETGAVTEYEFPVANEWGGPMWLTPGGDIVFGTRNRGYIMVFHVASKAFTSYPIPTSFAGLKDGLTVGDDGVIWFTESSRNKLARLVLARRTQ